MQELALQSVFFAKPFIKTEIAVLVVHDDGKTKLGEVQTDLVHPAGLDRDVHEGNFGEFFDDPVARQGTDAITFSSRQREVDFALVIG